MPGEDFLTGRSHKTNLFGLPLYEIALPDKSLIQNFVEKHFRAKFQVKHNFFPGGLCYLHRAVLYIEANSQSLIVGVASFDLRFSE